MKMICDGHLGGYIEGGDPRSFVPEVWSRLLADFSIETVLDVGCAQGHAMQWFAEHGCEVLGVEGCAEAIRTHLLPDRVLRHDFTLCPWSPFRAIDLVWCCEFLEHVEARFWRNLAPACCGRVLAVTAALPGQTGHHHVNEQLPDYWIERFERLGYGFGFRGPGRQQQGPFHFLRVV